MKKMTNNYNLVQAIYPMFMGLLFSISPLAAQAASPMVPSLQQVAPLTPLESSPSESGLLMTEPAYGRKLPQSAPFLVLDVQITDNTMFDTATLYALVADVQGQTITLPQLEELAARITSYYHNNNYPLARAIIPAQTIVSGVVRIQVIEASYGKINLDNHTQVKDALLQATLAPLQSGQGIVQTELDHVLLLVSNIPGVVAGATLKPGKVIGTSDLLVSTTPGPMVTGNMMLDNYGGYTGTGRARIGGTVNVINPLQHGDILTASGLSSGSGLNYARLRYETLFNGQGTRLGGAYSALRYALAGTLVALQANGSAQEVNLWAKHPLMRTRDVNLYGKLQFDSLQLRDHIGASAIKTDRSLENWMLRLAGDARDTFLSGGINTWSLGWTIGRVGFDNADAQVSDAGTADTQGRFSKLNVNLTRLQHLNPKNDLYLAFSGQRANGNLDASQKMRVGGPTTVRAYDTGALSVDTAYLATAELQHALGTAWGVQWQAVAFVDTAHVTVNDNTWGVGTNSATFSGAGVGINWTGPKQLRAKTYIATRTGVAPTLVANSASTRAWVEISKGF
jgi:hemolysin activation/secretion protein